MKNKPTREAYVVNGEKRRSFTDACTTAVVLSIELQRPITIFIMHELNVARELNVTVTADD